MSGILPDPATEFGERVARRLRDEVVIWMTVIDARGAPQSAPVWFLWENDSFLIYSRSDARRNEHIRRNPRVSLNFNANSQGGDIVVFTGEATLSPDEPPCDQVPAYVAKYGDRITRNYGDARTFAAQYSVAIRVRPTSVRGF